MLVLALVVLGPDKLPGFIRSAGRLYSELRKMASGFKAEFDEAMGGPLREMRDTADMAKRWFDSSDDDEVVDDGADDVVPDDDDESDPFASMEDDDDDDLDDDLDDDDDDDLDDDLDDDDDIDEDDTGDDDDDDGDDPNFYDENGNLLDATAIAALIDDAERRADGSGAAST